MPDTGERETLRMFLADRDAACPECGYNVRGLTTDACPECHRRLRLEIARIPRPSRRRWRLMVVLAAVGFARSLMGLWQTGTNSIFLWSTSVAPASLVTSCIFFTIYVVLGGLCLIALVQLPRTRHTDRALTTCDVLASRVIVITLLTWVVSLFSQTLSLLGIR